MRAHIITLKGHQLGERLSAECRAQAALFGIDVAVREAINGRGWQDHLLRESLKPAGFRDKKKTPGMFGNFFSHYYLWRECARGTEPYLILEHDGYFVRPLPQGVMSRFDHVLKLDDQDPYSRDYHTIMQQQHQEQRPTEILPMSTEGRKDHGAGFYSSGSYAYIIKPRACELLLSWIQDRGFLPTDNQLGLNVVDIRVCRPTVARLHPLFAEGNNIHTLSTAKFIDQLP